MRWGYTYRMSKYDNLFAEPINKGKIYTEYLSQFGVVIPKNTSFDRVRRYKEKKDSPKEV